MHLEPVGYIRDSSLVHAFLPGGRISTERPSGLHRISRSPELRAHLRDLLVGFLDTLIE